MVLPPAILVTRRLDNVDAIKIIACAFGASIAGLAFWRIASRYRQTSCKEETCCDDGRPLECDTGARNLFSVVLDSYDFISVWGIQASTITQYLGFVDAWRARCVSTVFANMSETYMRACVIAQDCALETTGTSGDSGGLFEMFRNIRGESDIDNVGDIFQLVKRSAKCLVARDCAGRSPIMRAAQEGKLRLAMALVEANSDLHGRGGNGWRPLHYAAVGGNVELCRFLLDGRADIDARSSDGFSALAYAREAGRDNVSIELISRGADPCAFDKKEGGGGSSTQG